MTERSVNPITLAVVGGAVIVVLIFAALHPPNGRSRGTRAAGSTPIGSACPAGAENQRACWVIPADLDPASVSPTEPEDPATDEPNPVAHPRPASHSTTRAPSTGRTSAPPDPPDDAGVPTVNCPDVKNHLPSIPAAARAEVNQNLAELQQQITDADARLAELAADPVDDPDFVRNTVLGPLKDRRVATLDRITIAIGRVTTPPSNLAARAPCTLDA